MALVTAGLAVVFAGFLLLSAQSMRDSTNRTLQERLVIAEVTAQRVDERLLDIANLAATVAATLPTQGGDRTDETRAGWRTLRLQFGAAVQRIVNIDSGGRILWTTPYDESLLGRDLSGMPNIRKALQQGSVLIDDSESSQVPSFLLEPDPIPTAALFSPIRSPQGGLVLIIVDLNQPGVADLLRQVELGQTGYTEIVGQDGKVLATDRPERLGVISDHGGHFAALIKEGQPASGTCHACHQGGAVAAPAEDVLAFAPLADAPWGVTVRQSSQEAFAFDEALFRRSLLFGAASFIAALVLSWLMVIRLVRPVKELTGACQRIAEGDLSRPVPAMGGGEIALLARSFEAMRARLRVFQDETRRWGRELEQKVSERTADLQKARDDLERSRDFLVTLFDSLEDQLAIIDRNYRIVDGNRALLRRFGNGGSPIGAPCHKVFRGVGAPCELMNDGCPAKQVWQTGKPARATRVHQNGSGNPTYLDIVASPIRDRHGQVVNVLEVARDVTEGKRLEGELRVKEEVLSNFMRKYMAVQEEERKRIARELHDDTAQSVTALALAVETALQAPAKSVADVRSLLEPARPLAERVSGEIDRIIHDLRPSVLDDMGLMEALGWYADLRLKPQGIRTQFEVSGEPRRLAPELETTPFRVAQEAMSNIARHSRAQNACIAVEFGEGCIGLDVEDDGQGFDARANSAEHGKGTGDSRFGLLGMRERVHLLKGSLSIESWPGEGTSVRARVPLRNGSGHQ